MHRYRLSDGLSSYLDAMRWISAVLVLLFHTRHILFSGDVAHGAAMKLFMALTSFGDEAVVIFFVISGFLVGGISARRVGRGAFDLSDYMIARFSRIYTVLVPALCLGLLLDLATMALFRSAPLQGPAAASVSAWMATVSAKLDTGTFLANLGMMQGIHADAFGSNTPLWSLSCEWWYYCGFAAIAVAVSRRSLGRAAAIAVFVAILAILTPKVLLLALLWMLGLAIIFCLDRERLRLPIWLSGTLFLLAMISTAYFHTKGWGIYVSRPIVAVTFGLTMISMMRRATPVPLAALHTRLASFSYSLYLIHMPVVYLLYAALTRNGLFTPGQPATHRDIALVVGIAVAVMGVAWIFARLTEDNTDKVRHFLAARLSRRDRSAQPG